MKGKTMAKRTSIVKVNSENQKLTKTTLKEQEEAAAAGNAKQKNYTSFTLRLMERLSGWQDLETLSERVQWVVSILYTNSAAAARDMKMNQSTLWDIIKQDTTLPRIKTVERISKTTGVSVEWLLEGRGDIFDGNNVFAFPIDCPAYEVSEKKRRNNKITPIEFDTAIKKVFSQDFVSHDVYYIDLHNIFVVCSVNKEFEEEDIIACKINDNFELLLYKDNKFYFYDVIKQAPSQKFLHEVQADEVLGIAKWFIAEM